MGRLHPLLVRFPIALILVAAVAELVAMATRMPEWRAVAVANVRAGAAFLCPVIALMFSSGRLLASLVSIDYLRARHSVTGRGN